MKKISKLLMIIMLAIMCVFILQNIAFAGSLMAGSIDTLFESEGDSEVNESAQNIVGAIIAIARVIAVGVAIIMLVVLAMKYMMAAPGDKADIKKHAVVYVVGAVVLFATSGILGIIAKFASMVK